MTKLCECGCGEPAPIAKMNHTKNGYRKGEPMRFVSGHQFRNRKWTATQREKIVSAIRGQKRPPEFSAKMSAHHKAKGIKPSAEAAAKGNSNRPIRENSPTWKGGVSFTNGRKCIYRPDHPRSHKNGYVYEHILVAEQSLGRTITPSEVVHHIDGDISNNDPSNLHVFASQSDHIRHHKEAGDLL